MRWLVALSVLSLVACASAAGMGDAGGDAPEAGTPDAGDGPAEDVPGRDSFADGGGSCPNTCQDTRYASPSLATVDCDCCPLGWWTVGGAERYEPDAPAVKLAFSLEGAFAARFESRWLGVEATDEGVRVRIDAAEGEAGASFTIPGADVVDLAWVAEGRPIRVELEELNSRRQSRVLRAFDGADRVLVAARDDEAASLGDRPRELGATAVLTPNARATCTAAPSMCWTFGVHGAELRYAGGSATVEAGETGELVTAAGGTYAFRAAYRLRCCAEGQCMDTSYTGQGAGWMIRRAL